MRILSRMLIPAILAMSALIGTAAGQSLAATVSPDYETALHSLISADDGQNVYDAALGKIVRFMGDVNVWPCNHGAIVTNTPGRTDFKLMHYSFGCGLQPVRNWPDGTEYWFGGALTTPDIIYNYGARVDVGSNCPLGCVVGNYITEFNAKTLALEGQPIQVTGSAKLLSLNTAVSWPGGHWMVGTQNCGWLCKNGQAIWVPNGDEANPDAWRFYSTLPGSLHIGTTVSLFRWDGDWYAVTKFLDNSGTYLEELSSECMAGCSWHLTGKTWGPLPLKSYSAQVDLDPDLAGKIDFTYAENDSAYYGLHWIEDVTP